MRSVKVSQAVGLRLGRAVRDEHGRVLLAMGTPITPGLADALLRRGHTQVYVLDGVADDLVPQNVVTDRTRAVAQTTVRTCFRQMEHGEAVSSKAVQDTVEAILSDLQNAGGASLEFDVLRSVSDYTFVHSVNVCVYALLVGQELGMSRDELRVLGAGALLHDVGKIFCADLCSKPSALDPDEWARIRQHPIDGFEMLRQHHDLHLFVAHTAFQHHERLDGSGYPRGLSGDKILPVARIVAVTDVYDAVTAERPHAPGRPPHQALSIIRDGTPDLFDESVVAALLRRMAWYPTGTPVLLADGSIGVVAEQGEQADEPRVRLLGRAGVVYPSQETVSAHGRQAITQSLTQWPQWLRPQAKSS